jgi:hypothetical protein
MNRIEAKHLLLATAAFAATVVAVLWSWNTLAPLFGAPEAQFRHAVAALVLIATLRVLTTHRRATLRRHRHP